MVFVLSFRSFFFSLVEWKNELVRLAGGGGWRGWRMENSCADEYGNERSLLLYHCFVLVDNVLCVCLSARVE